MPYDPVTQDLPESDMNYPTSNSAIKFMSAGETLNGRIFIAQGGNPHPTIVLLHGFPGTEPNGDLAHVFRRAGWNVVMFHPRGAWGSSGQYTFAHGVADVAAALDHFSTSDAQERYRIDPSRFVLMGHSYGGFCALMGGALNPQVKAMASLAGFNLGRFARQLAADETQAALVAQIWQEDVAPLSGTSGRALVDEIIAHRADWDLEAVVKTLDARPICLVAGSRDMVGSPVVHHTPLVNALAHHPRLTHHIFDADHGFSDSRLALAHLLVDWLNSVTSIK
jgi:uncharacterized protein